MKFLVDNQLPQALAQHLAAKGYGATHVLEVGLDGASDTAIWAYATKHSLVLITKDDDFSRRASQPDAKVQVVWVRLGNCRNDALRVAFDSVFAEMLSALQAGQGVVEIR